MKLDFKNKKNILLIILCLFFLPLLEFLFVVGYNSNYLISFPILILIFILTLVFLFLLINRLCILRKNQHLSNKKMKKGLKIFIIIIYIIYIMLITAGALILYGPYDKYRNLFVTTAMQTMNHQYLARIFYNDEIIQKIMDENYLIEIDESTDEEAIEIKTDEKEVYLNEYEEQLLKRNNPNDLYKLLNIKVGNANGYLVAIYDPSKISLIRSKFNSGTHGLRVVDMCKKYGGLVCINAGGFHNGLSNGSDLPQGYVIDKGQVIWTDGDSNRKSNIITLTKEGKLVLMQNITGDEAVSKGAYYGVEFGPFLIINGESVKISGTPYGVANKCVIAQRKDGVILFLVTEGETYIDGASLSDVLKVLENYGAYNAANLDGGQSTSLVINNTLVNSPNYLAKAQGGRYVVTGWGLIP